MEDFNKVSSLKLYLDKQNKQGKTIGFVPTMGALHDGHLSLLAYAKRENDIVLCSIFVNPTQFNDPADLKKYPRPIKRDISLLSEKGCDALFRPDTEEIYAQNEHWDLDLNGLDKVLEGTHRPGHFAGVTQVVYKLLTIMGPCKVYFGQKDYQQFRIIEYMVQKLNMPNKLVRCPILREADGLAMSSRNIHLNTEERQKAVILSKALFWFRDHAGEENALDKARQLIIDEKRVILDYFELIDGKTLQPVLPREISFVKNEVVIVAAAKVGSTRLIDNCIVKP